MLGHVLLAVGALITLGRTKAVVTNNCEKDVYIWSVPEQSDLANNLALKPGKRYEEPWRAGTPVSPGIAIKISPEPNGIYAAKGEINFQYSVDASNSSKIWISLSNVRGDDFHKAVLHTCDGTIKGFSGLTKQCSDTDEIELVLCGSERTVPSHDSTAVHVISDCIQRAVKRDANPRSPNVCSGRVITPNQSNPTLPLKTVMRHEAAKHAAGAPAYGSIPLESLFPEDIASQGAETYSSAIKPHGHVVMYTNPFYTWFTELWGPYDTVKAVLNNEYEALFPDRSWTSDDEVCESSRNAVHPTVPGGRRCLIPFCEEGNILGGDCGDVVRELELLSRYAGLEIEWTDDEDVCKSEFAARTKRDPSLELNSQGYRAPEKRFAPTPSTADNTLTAHHLNDVRNVCITTANEKLGKYFGAGVTERLVKIIFSNTRWVEHLDDCSPQAIAQSRDYHHKLIDKKQKKDKKCIHQLYSSESYGSIDMEDDDSGHPITACEGKTCKRLKKDLNSLSRDVGENWAWTDDEETCLGDGVSFSEDPVICEALLGTKTIDKLRGYWGETYRDILREIHPDIFVSELEAECSDDEMPYAKQWLHAHRVEGKRAKRCVSPYCQPYGADCSDVEDDLEELSKNVGRKTDWTTDDDACPEGTTYAPNQLAINKHAAGEAEDTEDSEEYDCIEMFCESTELPEGHCENQMDFFLQEVERSFGVKIAFRGPRCRATVTSVPIKQQRGEHELCRKDFCRRSNHLNHDCEKVERDFQIFLNRTAHLPAAKFTDSKNVCTPSLTRGSSEKHSQSSASPSSRLRTNKRNEKRDILDMELFVCMKSVCPAIKGADRLDTVECLKALQAAEDFSSLLFSKRLKLQNDPTVCRSKQDHLKICSKGLCHFDHHSCEEGKDLYRNYIEWIFGLNTKFGNTDDVCGPVLARATHTTPSAHCSKVYCAPYISGVDCTTLERDLSHIMPGISGTEQACQNEPLLQKVPTFSHQGKQFLCVKYLCSLLDGDVDCKLAFPHIQRYYREIHKVDIEPTIDVEVCDAPSKASSKQAGLL